MSCCSLGLIIVVAPAVMDLLLIFKCVGAAFGCDHVALRQVFASDKYRARPDRPDPFPQFFLSTTVYVNIL